MLRTRFAPTPSGYLHVGNAWSFYLTWLFAKWNGASIFLRIDDADSQRYRPEYLEDIFESLDWLGLSWDEGPRNSRDFLDHYRQELRKSMYNEYWSRLQKRYTKQIYTCACSRQTIHNQAKKTLSNQHHTRQNCLSQQEDNGGVRLELAHESLLHIPVWTEGEQQSANAPVTVESMTVINEVGDPLLWKKDGNPSYWWSSMVDDVHYKLNLIVRGEDLVLSSALQYRLAKLTELVPNWQPVFVHHGLCCDGDGQKLSKSSGAPALATMKARGVLGSELIARFNEYISEKLAIVFDARRSQNVHQLLKIANLVGPSWEWTRQKL